MNLNTRTGKMKIKLEKEADKGQSLSLEDIKDFVSQVEATPGSGPAHGIKARVSWGGRLTGLSVEVLVPTVRGVPVDKR